MTSERECFVYIVPPGWTEFVTAGRFRWIDDGAAAVGRFVYGRSYRERADAVELDPVELRLSAQVYETGRMQGFFGAIRDSMPDFWGRRVIERNCGVTELSEFDYLMQGPDDRAGALGFGSSVEPPAARHRFNRTLNLAALQRAADAILDDDREYAGSAGAQAEELLLLGTSMGGARPKAVVEHEGDLRIAKFGRSDDRWNDSRVEHGMLALARACGLNAAADSRIETVGGRDVLLVRRFDRDRADDGRSGAGYRRHRMVSALTLLRTGDGLADRGDWSYLLLADEVRRASARPEDDLRELSWIRCSPPDVRSDLLQRGGVQPGRSPAQSRAPRQGTTVAAEPRLRPDAFARGGAGAARPRDDLRPFRALCQQDEPAERSRAFSARSYGGGGGVRRYREHGARRMAFRDAARRSERARL